MYWVVLHSTTIGCATTEIKNEMRKQTINKRTHCIISRTTTRTKQSKNTRKTHTTGVDGANAYRVDLVVFRRQAVVDETTVAYRAEQRGPRGTVVELNDSRVPVCRRST